MLRRSAVAVLAVTLAPVLARAQEGAPDGMVPVRITADAPALHIEVVRDHSAETYTCAAPCTLWVPAGRYRVSASGEGIPSKRQRLDAYGPASVDVQAGASGPRIAGLVIGIAGSTAMLVGLAGLVAGCVGECRMEHTNRTPWLVVGGIGAVGALIGWPIFGASGTSITTRAQRPLTQLESLRVAVLPTAAGGLTFAAAGTF